jgi:Flp pilus assembly protein TadD
VSKSPRHAEDLFIEGNRLISAGDARGAEVCFRELIGLLPDFAEAHARLGQLLDQEGMAAEAERHYSHTLSLNPEQGEIHLNLGLLLTKRKQFEEAEAHYRQALELIPDSAAAWSNLGVLQACRKEEKDAELSYRMALAIDPDHRLAYFNLSYLLLRQGRFEEGWRCLEMRDWYEKVAKNITSPRWRGESLQGRSLLISFEAGHGDMIQFCRYAKVLKNRGAARITLVCHPALKTLFTTLDGVDAVLAFDEPLPPAEWDFWTPPLSIPFYCRTRLDSIPAEIPYLRADGKLVERWASVMFAECAPSDLRVGLVWKGNPRFENDSERSLPGLKTFESLGDIAGVRFFSLQKGAGEDEAACPPDGLSLVNLGSRIADFADSMARKCWVLLPDYMTDWRWLTGRTDSPWYPGVMRLFRQPRMGEWATVVAEVCTELRRFKEKHNEAGAFS